MNELLQALLRRPSVGRAARAASDWVDLQLAHVVDSLARLAPRARGRLLDVGCGDKPYEHLFRPHVLEYLGVEHEATYGATAARSRGKADMLYDGERLPFPDASFDTVLSVQVLEHTPRPDALVAEMARVLRPGGLLILSAPFSFRLHEEPHDYFRFSPHGLRALCGRAGLVVEEIHPHGSLWSLLGHKLNSYLALQVAQIGGVAQSMGKLGHEAAAEGKARVWTLPLVAPAMVAVAAGARALDRALPDRTETLGFTLAARRGAAQAP
ncbi:class I SAM-dependent methyltransferase [Sorangium sp. So ce1182]|uniref:class I SAM-dependent methyltransferase n=1 Tax=Sorangium sp. So ce1182 TaxID=3133334 RepID=UPI003F615345